MPFRRTPLAGSAPSLDFDDARFRADDRQFRITFSARSALLKVGVMRVRHVAGGVRVEAPAKLNLFLEILGKRPDGYHELETLMVTIGWYDTLVFREEPTDRVVLHCFDAGPRPRGCLREAIPVDERNLVVRAAQLLKKRAGATQGVSITLAKRIPAAAGLAGGSSDAAATLAALNRLWGLSLADAELQTLAAELGSDVPFFLAESPLAVCRGRGETIEPLVRPARLFAVVVKPPIGLSTAEVYRHCRPADVPRPVAPLVDALRTGDIDRLARAMHNALQPPAEILCPSIKEIAEHFATEPHVAHQMSGSGSAYFGLCRDRRPALRLAARLRARGLGQVAVAEICP